MSNRKKIKPGHSYKRTPLGTAEMLYKILSGFVGINLAFDDKNGEPDKKLLKARRANYGLVRSGTIAADFIVRSGLEAEYREYEKLVDLEVVKIRDRVGKDK